MGYDFSSLNDKDFEMFVCDLLSESFGNRIEYFKTGKDKGIDGRFFASNGAETILQAKHYANTDYSGLKSKIKTEELAKVRKLLPNKYIFVTSIPLSHAQKAEIKTLFDPFITREDDVLGREDLNQILSKYPQIEKKYYRLWMSSTAVLQGLINNAIEGRSAFKLEQIAEKSKKYVVTASHKAALEKLSMNQILIIVGAPGVGKTTLADSLCLEFALKGYEFVFIEEDLSEAENIFQKGKKQIFYYDDFLGSNYFEAIENKKDSHIVNFIERIKKDKTKLFILTSRANILQSGIAYSSVLGNYKLQQNEYLLRMNQLTEYEKAQILYNHLWFGDLLPAYIDEIYEEKRYRAIINHKNFNPRTIEFITDIDRVTIDSFGTYWNYAQSKLNNPQDIWDSCFKSQINDFVRNLVLLVVFNNGVISEDDLRTSYERLNKLLAARSTSHIDTSFNSMVPLAVKTFLNKNLGKLSTSYSLFDPSVTDYIVSEYHEETNKVLSILRALQSRSSLQFLKMLVFTEHISREALKKIQYELLKDSFNEEVSENYLICLLSFDIDQDHFETDIVSFLQKLITDPIELTEKEDFFYLLGKYENKLDLRDYGFLIEILGKGLLMASEIETFTEFIASHKILNKDVHLHLGDICTSYLLNQLNDEKDQMDLSFILDEDGEILETAAGKVFEELVDLGERIIEGFSSELINDLDIDISSVVEKIDIEQMMTDYVEMLRQEDNYEEYMLERDSMSKDIDDLFDRT